MNLEGKRDCSSAYAKDEDGVLLREVELIRERGVRWFHTLLHAKSSKLDPNIAKGLDQWPENMLLGVQPTMQELADATRSWANGNAFRPDGVSVELFKITLNDDPALHPRLLGIVVRTWRESEVPQKWKYAINMVLYTWKDWTECGNYKGVSLVVHTRKTLLKIIAHHLIEYGERVGILPEEQRGFRPNRITTDMMFVIRRLHELSRKKQIPLYVCFVDHAKAYEFVDRTFLWTVLARFNVPQNVTSVTRQLHEGMRARVGLDYTVCSGRLAVEHGLRQGCVLAPRLFNIYFVAVIHEVYTRFNPDKDVMGALVHLKKKERGRGAGRGEATA